MAQVPSFHAIFGSDPSVGYPQKLADQISQHRRELDGRLFFDRLLQTIGLEESISLYPPRSNKDLHSLYLGIADAASPAHHKQSLLYYLLLDLSIPRRLAGAFALEVLLPLRYATLMDGLWRLDRMELEAAVAGLTAPALLPTFADETLLLLCQHAGGEVRAEVALGYYEAVTGSVSLGSPALDAVTRVMARISVTQAFFHIREQAGDTMRRRLFEVVIWSALGGNHGGEDEELRGETRAHAAADLVGLPLDASEEEWLTEFLLDGGGKNLHGAKDAVAMRCLLKGDFEGAQKLSGMLDGQDVLDSVNWSGILRT